MLWPYDPRGQLFRLGLLVGAMFCVLMFTNGWGFPCSNDFVAKYPSPDGRHKVLVFTRGCGATTSTGTNVSLLPWYGLPPWWWCNAFVADSDHGRVPEAARGGPRVDVRWADDSELVLTYDDGARIYVAEPRVDDVTIRYETRGTPHD